VLNDYGRTYKPLSKVRPIAKIPASDTGASTLSPLADQASQLSMTMKLAKFWLRQLKSKLAEERTEKNAESTEKVIEHEEYPKNHGFADKWLSVGLGR
jgi:hypothetical protein